MSLVTLLSLHFNALLRDSAMPRSFTSRFATPGELSESTVFVASATLILAICLMDVETGNDIRLRILYVFPLAAIALHSKKMQRVFLGFFLAVACQICSLLKSHLHVTGGIIDGLTGIGASLLVIVLARTARKHYLETLMLATRDPLTGLHNRHSFELIADLELTKQRRYGGVFSLAVIDLDGFKSLNDSRGHNQGDRALNVLADALLCNTRDSDSIARMGGDEFAILLPMALLPESIELCERLCVAIASRMTDAGFTITASIGCATFETAPRSLDDALQKADEAMYAAKSRGKGVTVTMSV
jgi:diguanylate cyclase (GGDEF)-like protein